MIKQRLLSVVLLLLLLANVHALKIIALGDPLASSSGFNFQDESPLGSFVVGVGKTGPPEGIEGRPLPITSPNGTSYICYLPLKQTSSFEMDSSSSSAGESRGDDDDHTAAPLSSANDPSTTEKSPEEMVNELGDFCVYRVEEWWTYELCYKKSAQQYHAQNNKVVDRYHLGNYSAPNSDMVAAPLEDGEGIKYVHQKYLGGAPCSVTGSNRSVEVRFVCGRGAQTMLLLEVREPQSCAYVFIVSVPRLCKHSFFKDRVPTVTPIVCYETAAAAAAAEDATNMNGECSSSSCSSAEGVIVAGKPIPLPVERFDGGGGGDDDENADEGRSIKRGAAVVPENGNSNPNSNSSSSSISTAVLEEGEEVEHMENHPDGVGLDDVFGHDEYD